MTDTSKLPLPPANPSAMKEEPTFFGQSAWLFRLTLLLVFALGLGIRLIDFSEPPLDFYPDRQLQSAIVARGLYYEWRPDADPDRRQTAITLGRAFRAVGPPAQETLVALTYLAVGGEHLWLARVWSIIEWMVGAGLLFGLARRWTNVDGAVVAVAYFLVVSMGVQVSRAFLPDALMVTLLVGALAAADRWASTRSVPAAILAGLLGGLVVWLKGRPAFLVAALLVGTVLAVHGFRRLFRDPQVWLMGLAAVSVPAIYYLVLTQGTAGYLMEASDRIDALVGDPSFYMRWAIVVDGVASLGLATLGLLGVTLLPRIPRTQMFGLWIGYGLYGLALTYNIITHSYYSVLLIPLVGISLGPVAKIVLGAVSRAGRWWMLLAAAVLVGWVGYRLALTRATMLSTDFRRESPAWVAMGRELPSDGAIIGLVHDYGFRLAYYGWRQVTPWPVGGDLALYALQGRTQDVTSEEAIRDRLEPYRYFLVTLSTELDRQPALKAYLEGQPVVARGDGYFLYDLAPVP